MRRGNYRQTGWFVAKRSHGKKIWELGSGIWEQLALRDLPSLPLSSPSQSCWWVSSQSLPMVLFLMLLLSFFLSMLLLLKLSQLKAINLFVEFQRYLCCRFCSFLCCLPTWYLSFFSLCQLLSFSLFVILLAAHIPDIYQLCYKIALFEPEKSTPKVRKFATKKHKSWPKFCIFFAKRYTSLKK